jgi:polyisoprenoid-binding protein YceI
MRYRHFLIPLLAALTVSLCYGEVYPFDPAQSTVEVLVPKAGLLSFVGHEHSIRTDSVSGRLNLNADQPAQNRVSFSIPVTSLTVLDPSLGADDRATVTEHMHAIDVLNAESFGTISFTSSSVKASTDTRISVRGTLIVAGQKAEIKFDADIYELPNGGVSVKGETTLELADFGIKPVSALAGAVKTGKSVQIKFLVATLAPQQSRTP